MSSLEVLAWTAIYKYKSKDEQVKILKEIMSNIDIFSINLADDMDQINHKIIGNYNVMVSQVEAYKYLKCYNNDEPSIKIVKRCKDIINILWYHNTYIYKNIKLNMITLSTCEIQNTQHSNRIIIGTRCIIFNTSYKSILIRLNECLSITMFELFENDKYYEIFLENWKK